MEQEPDSKKQLLTTLAVLVFIVVVVGGAVFVANSGSGSSGPTSSQGQSSGNRHASNATYQDGTYTATGSYVSPGGSEDITVSVTLDGNIVTETSARSGAHSPEGREFQAQFIGGYKERVIGKDINEISLSQVSGSSLTSQGFNDALDKIKDQAQS